MGLMKTLCTLLLILTSLPALAVESFSTLHAGDLATLMSKNNEKVAIFDANTTDTRKKDGIIPGATMLSSSGKYDISKELPSDKNTQLVFYCANLKCTASHDAAKRAIGAGYSHVAVMVDGIQGWKKSGHETAQP